MTRQRFRLPDGKTLFEEVAALAAAQARGGRRVPTATTARLAAARKAKREARQKAATDRWHEERRQRTLEKRKRMVLGERWRDRCVRVMQPGQWYADRDLQNLMGAQEDQPVQWSAQEEGLIERRRNPDWKGQNRYGEMQQPKWLYRLTAAGEARRELCELLY